MTWGVSGAIHIQCMCMYTPINLVNRILVDHDFKICLHYTGHLGRNQVTVCVREGENDCFVHGVQHYRQNMSGRQPSVSMRHFMRGFIKKVLWLGPPRQ